MNKSNTKRPFSFNIYIFGIALIFIPKLAYSDNEPSCEIENIFLAKDVPDGALSLSSSGNTEEIRKILLPTKLDIGKYSINIKRIDGNLYSVGSSDTYIKTKHCYEYTYGSQAILNITSPYGSTNGKVIFMK